MKTYQKRILSGAAGAAIVIGGAFAVGFDWHPGPNALELYVYAAAGAFIGAIFPFKDEWDAA